MFYQYLSIDITTSLISAEIYFLKDRFEIYSTVAYVGETKIDFKIKSQILSGIQEQFFLQIAYS